MAAVHPPRPEFESPSAHFPARGRRCRSCGIQVENELFCNFCHNGSDGIRTADLSDESAETLALRRALGVLRFTHEEEEEEEENGGVVNYFDCLGNNAEDFWVEEKEDEEEEIEQFEETENGDSAMPWEDVVISSEFHQDFDVRHRGQIHSHTQSQNLWAEVDPLVFGRSVEGRVSVEEEEEEVVFEFHTLRDYAEDYEVDLFKRVSNSENDEFGLFDRRSSILGLAPRRGDEEEEDYPEVSEQNMNSNPNPILNSNPNPNPNPRGHDSFDPFEWNSVAEDEGCNSSSGDEDVPSSIGDSETEDLCIACTSWDSFGIEENNEDNHEEWEELYGEEEAVVFSRSVAVEENNSNSNSNFPEELGVEPTGNFGWTSVLEDFRGIEFTYEEDDIDDDVDVDLDVDVDTYFGDPEDYADEAGYEVLLEQFAEVNNFPRGAPPTSKVVLNSLPSVFIRQEEIDNGNAWCPICKEGLNMGEAVKVLPCSHHYHGECILPWLRCRNSCPVCRFELPTDDPEYEMQRKQDAFCEDISVDLGDKCRSFFTAFNYLLACKNMLL